MSKTPPPIRGTHSTVLFIVSTWCFLDWRLRLAGRSSGKRYGMGVPCKVVRQRGVQPPRPLLPRLVPPARWAKRLETTW
eukprot:9139248-Alexandrium_andersonii.AAC.1